MEGITSPFRADVVGSGSWSRVHFLVSCLEFVALFLEYAEAYYRRPDGTPTGHAVNLEIALRWWKRDLPVTEVGLAELQEYREALIRRGLRRKTCNQYVGWCVGAFRWGAEAGHLPDDVPARMGVLRPLRAARPAIRERQPPTRAELVALANEARGVSGNMVRVQWLAGMRPREVRLMRWEEIRWESRCAVYAPRRHKVEHYGRDRWIILVPEALALLGDRQRDGYVFRTRLGGPYSDQGYRQELQRACERLGIRRIGPADIRRASATYARRVGGAERAQRLLGHASTAMTEEYFGLGWMDQAGAVDELVDRGWTLRDGELGESE